MTETAPVRADSRVGRTLLEVENLAVSFGGIKAVDGLSFSVHEGEIVSVIGPNGAGKTSAFNCMFCSGKNGCFSSGCI